jgi:hypothetical protein
MIADGGVPEKGRRSAICTETFVRVDVPTPRQQPMSYSTNQKSLVATSIGKPIPRPDKFLSSDGFALMLRFCFGIDDL